MTATPRGRSNWFLQNYEKIILIFVLTGLLGSALFLILEISATKQELTEARWEKPQLPPKMVAPVDLATSEQALAAIHKPIQAGSHSNRLMVSELRVSCIECQKPIPFSATVCPFCQAKQPEQQKPDEVDNDGDGIPDEFERAHGLNPQDHDDAYRDMDSDGFSNLEEFQSKTDINNAAEYPSPAAKLRIVNIGTNPFKLRFQGEAHMPDGSMRYQLNLRSLERTYFVSVGQSAEGFEVMEYTTNAPGGATIVLKKGDTVIRLTKGKVVDQFEKIADLVFLIDGSRYRVKIDDTLTIRERDYKVIDIKGNGVLIRDVKTSKDTMVGPRSESEKSMLQRGAGGPVPQGPAVPFIRNH